MKRTLGVLWAMSASCPSTKLPGSGSQSHWRPLISSCLDYRGLPGSLELVSRFLSPSLSGFLFLLPLSPFPRGRDKKDFSKFSEPVETGCLFRRWANWWLAPSSCIATSPLTGCLSLCSQNNFSKTLISLFIWAWRIPLLKSIKMIFQGIIL